jgi:hypothetical protein
MSAGAVADLGRFRAFDRQRILDAIDSSPGSRPRPLDIERSWPV